MTERVDPKKLSVPAAAPKVPVVPKPASKWKQFRRLMADAEEIEIIEGDMRELWPQLRNRKPGEPPPDLRDAQLLDGDKRKIARCRHWLHDLDRADYYEEGDENDERPILRKEIISERLALMLGAVHVGGPQTPEVFITMLLEHVYDAEVSYLALESGCRQIEQTEKFVPAISEVLKVLKEHDRRWNARKMILRGIEVYSNNLQNEIGQAQAKLEAERAKKRLDEATNRLKGDVWQINDAQGRARQAYQNVEAAMDRLAEDQAVLDAAVAAAAPVPALLQSRSEWQQFHILMDDLDVVRSRYDDLLSELYGLRGDKPPLRLYAELIGFDKRKAACCRQWLPEIDRRDYYEEAIVGREDGPLPTSPRLSEKTISARLSLMLDSVTGGPQNKEIFRQNLVQYVYGAEVCSLALESACREIEQTGEYPTIAKVLKILKDHQEQWDKRQRALSNIEELRKHYAGKRLKETEDSLRKRQEEARAAYLRVEEAMERLAKDQQRCAEAKAALDAAGAAAKAVDDDRQA